MKEPKDRFHEINTENPDFQAQIDAITDRDLTPDNIASYADDALTNFIAVIDKITSSYDRHPTISHGSGADNERAALRYAGLDPDYIEVTLDHIADIATDIERAAFIAEQLTGVGVDIITPPDEPTTVITVGSGTFESKKTIPRLQTTLLILEKNFGINIDPKTSDPEELRFIPGAVTDDMMRQTPYDIIDLPKLNRVIDVCDEEGNRTFVFDRSKLIDSGVSIDALKHMTKDELKDLLATKQAIGRDLVYSNRFVENLVSLLNEIPRRENLIATSRETAKLLKPEYGNTPEGFLPIQGVCKSLGYGRELVTNAIASLSDQLGDPMPISVGPNRTFHVYSPVQIDMIKRHIIEQGILTDTPEGYLTRSELSTEFNVGEITILRAIQEVGDQLGQILTARSPSGTNYRPIYSPSQQDTLRTYLREKGTLTTALEGQLGLKELAVELGLERNAVMNAIEALKDQLGEITRAKLGKSSVPRPVYTLEQQNIVRDYFEKRGMLTPLPPEGYKSLKQIADALGVSWRPIMTAIEEIGGSLGQPIKAKFQTIVTDAYSPDQQDMIKSHLEAKGTLVSPPPEGYLSAKGMEKLTGLTRGAIERAVEKLGGKLGPIMLARVGANRVSTYSPTQQKQIFEWLEQNMRRRSDSKLDFALAKTALLSHIGEL